MVQRAVVYCRVSTDDQSCERQQRDLEAFASRAGYEIVGVFHENASGADDARPERRKVIELARGRKVDAVLVTELSRWGRSTVDLVNTLDDLHSWGVSVIAQTGLSFDLATPSGKLMRTLMAGLAEFERDLVRERVLVVRKRFNGVLNRPRLQCSVAPRGLRARFFRFRVQRNLTPPRAS